MCPVRKTTVSERPEWTGNGDSRRSEPGILLVGHGTRDDRGIAGFHAVSSLVAANFPESTVEPCFLELCEPSVAVGIDCLVRAGARHLAVAPVLLFSAGHARRDIPVAVGKAMAATGGVRWTQAAHLGCHPATVKQSAARFCEALRDRQPAGQEPDLLLFVGRGSQDERATAEAHEFAAKLVQQIAVPSVEVCFYAMAKPSLKEVLPRVARAGFRRVVVLPHLLFEGQIAEGIRDAVRSVAESSPDVEWLVAETLGPTELVAQAITDRLLETLIFRQSPGFGVPRQVFDRAKLQEGPPSRQQ